MFKFQVIASSSDGNASILEFGNKKILIDAGFQITGTKKFLLSKNLTIEDIDAIFITHDHGDHCKALESFSHLSRLKVFANRQTKERIVSRYPKTKSLAWNLFSTSDTFIYEDALVNAFALPHDADDTVGYKFTVGKKNLVYATDLGKVTTLVSEIVKTANILVLECNHCPDMLENSPRPMNLKARVKGNFGHLSNQDAINLLTLLDSNFVEKIYLTHISKDCNDLALISNLLENSLSKDLLSKVEIVCPHKGLSQIYEA